MEGEGLERVDATSREIAGDIGDLLVRIVAGCGTKGWMSIYIHSLVEKARLDHLVDLGLVELIEQDLRFDLNTGSAKSGDVICGLTALGRAVGHRLVKAT